MEAIFKGDNIFYYSSIGPNSIVNGLPKLDTYTGIYSQYAFSTSTQNENNTWEVKASSTIGGFRWEEPEPFLLTATNTSLVNQLYYYNVTKNNTNFDLNSYGGHATVGYQNLGSISISNKSGTPLADDQYLVSTFIADETSLDVIKKIEIPTCPVLGEDSIYVVAYEYANGAKYYYTADSDAAKPYVMNNGIPTIYATGDNEIVKLEVALTSWGAAQTGKTFAIYGYIEDTSDLARIDQHYFGYQVYDALGEPVEGLADGAYVNSTFKKATTTGADVRIQGLQTTNVENVSYDANYLVAGRSSEIKIDLFGGALNNLSNGYWSDITFNVVLPDGITLDAVNGLSFVYERNGTNQTIATNETIGNIIVSETKIDEATAQDYFDDDTITGATVYTCTLEDNEALLYGIRVGLEANSFAKMTISLDITPDVQQQQLLLPWSKVILLGSNSETYSSFTKLNGVSDVGAGIAINNYDNDFKVGVTSSIVSGSTNQYLYIDSVPELMVHGLSLTTNDKTYIYSESNEDSIAVLHANDTASLNYTITNTVNDEAANKLESYVVLSLPKQMNSSSSLSTTSDFEAEITKITVNNQVLYGEGAIYQLLANSTDMLSTSEATINVKYINSSSEDVSSFSSVAALYGAGTSTYDDSQNYDLMVLKIEDNSAFSSFDVNVDITMPNHETTKTEYVAFEGMSAYSSTTSSKLLFNSKGNANSSIKFAYENPKWLIDVVPVVVNEAGYITGSLDVDINDLEVLHNGLVYDNDSDKEHYLSAPEVIGYTFDGWYLDEDLTKLAFNEDENFSVTSNMTIYASYKMNDVSVTYQFNNGDEDFTKTVSFDTLITNPSNPYKSGYTFLGWFIDEACEIEVTQKSYGEISGNDTAITLYAGYSLNPTYNVYYDIDGFVDNGSYETNDVVTIPSDVPTKLGHDFTGWLYNGSVYQPNAILAMGHADINFEAQWTLSTFTIKYQDEDGTKLLDDSNVKYTEQIVLLAPENKEGYTFNSWKYSEVQNYTPGMSYTMPSHDVIFVAKWDINNYTLSFDNVNIGELDEEYLEYDYDVYSTKLDYKETLTLPTPERIGYKFTGWSDGETTYDLDATFTMGASDTTLSATWEVLTFIVTFDGVDAKDIVASDFNTDYELTYDADLNCFVSKELGYGTIITLPTPSDTLSDHFLHWVVGEGEDAVEYIGGNTYSIPTSDTVFTAIWQVKTYELIFKDEGDEGHIYFDKEMNLNDEMTLPTPSKEGYTFNGWTIEGETYDADNNPYGAGKSLELTTDIADKANSDLIITFIANWTINEYTITFDLTAVENEDKTSIFADITKAYGTNVTIPNVTPIKEGDDFLYWSDGINHYAPGAVITMPEGGLELHPVFSTLSYTLSYTDEKGNHVSSQTLPFGTTINLPVISQEGYTFDGWSDGTTTYAGNASYTVPANNVEFEAQWTAKEYQVIFDYHYDDIVETNTYAYGSEYTLPTPTRTGYTFKGWLHEDGTYDAGTELTLGASNETYTALWEINSYTLSFKNTGDVALSDVELDYQQDTMLPEPIKTGYSFVKWVDEDNNDKTYNAYDIFTMELSNITLTAEWEINQYEIIFDQGYNGVATSTKLDFDSTITFEDLTRVGYTFDGWLYDGQLYTSLDEIKVVAETMTFVAQWSAIEYTITFENTGNEAIEDKKVACDAVITLPTPKKTGYTFVGWSEGEILITPNSEYTMGSNNVTLTGNWEINKYEITYDYDYDGITVVEKLEYNSTITLEDLTRVGYTFEGWLYNGEVYTSLDEIQVIDGAMNFVAVWKVNKYELSFNDTGDTTIDSVVLAYNTSYKLLVVTKEGYKFVAWEDADGNLYNAEEVITMKASNMELTAIWLEIDETNEDLEDDNVDTDSDVETSTPDTGDTTSRAIYVFSLALSTLFFLVLAYRRKRIS